MSDTTKSVLITFLLLTHAMVAAAIIARLVKRQHITVGMCGSLSVFLYYDVALLCELAGVQYVHSFLQSVWAADDYSFSVTVLLTALAPFLFLFGEHLVPLPRNAGYEGRPHLAPHLRRLFYPIVVGCSLIIGAWGASTLWAGQSVWTVRAHIGDSLGVFIIILYLPLCLLAYYLSVADCTRFSGFWISCLLSACAILATLPIGQRTLILLPLVMVGTFRRTLRLGRTVALTAAVLLVAAVLLPVFKWQFAGDRPTASRLIENTVFTDLARANVTADAVARSPMAGTGVMPYPLAGYVYSALFYIPRMVVPFKGQSTAVQYTAVVTGSEPDQTHWGLGVGAIDEAVLNAGVLFAVPLLLLYGIAMAAGEHLCRRYASLRIPIRLASVSVCGHHLPALILLFGTMAIVCWLCHVAFVRYSRGPVRLMSVSA